MPFLTDQDKNNFVLQNGLDPSEFTVSDDGSQFIKKQRSVQPTVSADTVLEGAQPSSDDSPAMTFAKSFAQEAPSAITGGLGAAGGVAGAGALAAGIGLAPETFGASLLLPLLFGAGGAYAGSKLGRKATEMIEPESWQQNVAASQAQNPLSATAGGLATLPLGGFNPSPSNVVRAGGGLMKLFTRAPMMAKEAQNLVNVGIGGALGAGQSLIEGGSPMDIAKSAGIGLLFNKPNAIGRKLFHIPSGGTKTIEVETPTGKTTIQIPITPETDINSPLYDINKDLQGELVPSGIPESPQQPEAPQAPLKMATTPKGGASADELAKAFAEGQKQSSPEYQAALQNALAELQDQMQAGQIAGDETRPQSRRKNLPNLDRANEQVANESPADLEARRLEAELAGEKPPKYSDESTLTKMQQELTAKLREYSPTRDWFKKLAEFGAKKRGITTDIKDQVVNAQGEPIAGQAFLRENLGPALNEISAENAGADTSPHEMLHVFFDDLQKSNRVGDKRLMEKYYDAISKSPEYAEWKSGRDNEKLSSTPEEYAATNGGYEFLRQHLNLMGESPLRRWWNDFRSHLKTRYTEHATPEDYQRLLNYRLMYDKPFRVEGGQVGGAAGKSQEGSELAKRTASDLGYNFKEAGAVKMDTIPDDLKEAISKLHQASGWEFTHPDTGVTFYTRIGATPEEIRARAQAKDKEFAGKSSDESPLRGKVYSDLFKEGAQKKDDLITETIGHMAKSYPEGAEQMKDTTFRNEIMNMLEDASSHEGPHSLPGVEDIDAQRIVEEYKKANASLRQAAELGRTNLKNNIRNSEKSPLTKANIRDITGVLKETVLKSISEDMMTTEGAESFKKGLLENIDWSTHPDLHELVKSTDFESYPQVKKLLTEFQQPQKVVSPPEEVKKPKEILKNEKSASSLEPSGWNELIKNLENEKITPKAQEPQVAKPKDYTEYRAIISQHDLTPAERKAVKSKADADFLRRMSEYSQQQIRKTSPSSESREANKSFLPSIIRPEIDKVAAIENPKAEPLANAFTNFYTYWRQYKGKLQNDIVGKLMEHINMANPKEAFFQNNEKMENVLDWLYKKQDNQPLPTLSPEEQTILDKVKDTFAKAEAERVSLPTLAAKKTTPFNPDAIWNVPSRRVLDVLLNKAHGPEYDRLMRDWDSYWGAKGLGPAEITQKYKEFGDSFLKDRANLAQQFSPIDRDTSLELPRSWRENNLMDIMSRFTVRYGRRLAYHRALESDPVAWDALTNPRTRLANNQAVSNVMDNISGVRENEEAKRSAAGGLVRAGMLGPLTGSKDLVTTPTLGLQHVTPRQALLSLYDAVKNIKQNIKEAYDTGVNRYNIASLEFGDGGIDNLTQVARRVRDVLNVVQGRNFLEKTSRALAYGQGKFATLDNLAQHSAGTLGKTGEKFLNDFAPSDWRTRALSPEEVNETAAKFVESVQGTYDYRGLPSIAQQGSLAPYLSLARWNIEKLNNFDKYVVQPARQGNYTPLLMSTVGMILGGEAVTKLVELVTHRKEKTPKLEEIAASDEQVKGSLYKLAGLASLSGYAGILGDLTKSVGDIAFHNQPQTYNNPLISAVTTVGENAADIVEALSQGDLNITTDAISQFLENTLQVYRISLAQLSDKKQQDLSDTDKLRDLKLYKNLNNIPTSPASSDRPNLYLNPDLRDYKKDIDLNEAVERLPGLVDRAFSRSGNNPEQLEAELQKIKENSYQTMPNPDRMPLSFIKYLQYLYKTQPDDATERLIDYMQRNTVNKVKSELVPSL